MVDWNTSLSLGITEIDEQHQSIIHLIQFLCGKGPSFQRKALDQIRLLRTTIAKHFETEEELMADVSYPDLDSHHQQHELCINHLLFYEIEMAFGVPDEHMHGELTRFLTNWFHEHIALQDKAVGLFLRDQAMRD